MFYRTPKNIISIPRNILAIPTILRQYLEISIPRSMVPIFIFCCCRTRCTFDKRYGVHPYTKPFSFERSVMVMFVSNFVNILAIKHRTRFTEG